MKNNQIKGTLLLVLASLIWGLAFVAQSDAADKVPPLLFNSLRSLVGAGFLLIVLAIRKGVTHRQSSLVNRLPKRRILTAGLLCGILLTLSVNLQQLGISLYPDGTAVEARGGFLTAIYVIIVPMLSIFAGKRPKPAVLGAGIVAMLGIYLLCLAKGLDHFYLGDVLILSCAFSFSLHIMTVDRYGAEVGGILLSMMQFAVCGVLSGILSLILENSVPLENILAAMPQILFLGIGSSGIAYTLQIIGQKYAEPAVASITMSLESVFAALGGWLISHNTLTVREMIGCVLVFAAILLAQCPQISAKPENAAVQNDPKD